MESTMMHASELPSVELLTGEELQQFAEREFHPSHYSQGPEQVHSLMKEVRYGMVGANRWYIQRNTTGWRATREPGGNFLDWKGQRFPTATAAWVDAELRQWGEP